MKPPTIAIADDDPAFSQYLSAFLESRGYQSRIYARGEELLAAAHLGELPDVVLLDVMMPGTDGPTTLALLRARPETAATPVIFLTAKVQKAEVARLLELGAKGVLAKPFDPMTLPDEVRRVLNG